MSSGAEDFGVSGYSSLQDFSQDVLKRVVQATQHANALTASPDDHEYWNSFEAFQHFCSSQGTRIIQDISKVMRHHAVPTIVASEEDIVTGVTAIDVDERFEKLVESNDFILENVGSLLDEAAGYKKHGQAPGLPSMLEQGKPVVSSWNRKQTPDASGKFRKSTPFRLLMARNIARPQLKWLDKIDNSNTPFVPRLKAKPNARKPLEADDGDDCVDAISSFIRQARMGGDAESLHPYQYELELFEPNDWQWVRQPAEKYLPLDETQLTMIDTSQKLAYMMAKLKEVRELAVDLEHHNYRSFQGFVCLMQISTRKEDFIVDTLCLRDELSVLNEVFTDTNVLKVLHGADSDIGWLQRDFGVYVVNMFDTGQAARTLQEDRFSLAHLMKKHCGIDAQKQYQLADWRIRPLPHELIKYAREDTHYLLYIYDCVRNELIDRGNEMKNLLRSVYTKSASLCISLYEKPIFTPDSYLELYQKYRGRLSDQQLECFRLVFAWRDKVAREEDESLGYVLPNHMLFQIAEKLPKEPQGVLACCTPVPPLVKQRVVDLHRLVVEARDYDPSQARQPSGIEGSEKIGVKLPDTSGSVGLSEKTKTGFELYSVRGPAIKVKVPDISIFEDMVNGEITEGQRKAQIIWNMLRSPFEMYFPNTGKTMADPAKINKAWQEASQNAIVEEERSETASGAKSTAAGSESRADDEREPVSKERGESPAPAKKPKPDVVEMTLREMLPKKQLKKMLEANSGGLHASSDAIPSATLSYEKAVTKKSDYVPFDYSNADKSKFSGGNTAKVAQTDLVDIIEAPVRKGPLVKTRVRSKTGERSMMFK